MIYATYLAINQGVNIEDEINAQNVKALKRHVYPSIDQAVLDFLSRVEKTQTPGLRYGLLCHGMQDLGAEREVIMIRTEDKMSFKRTKLLNPFFRLEGTKRKNVALMGKKPSQHASMHQRMLQLLLLSNATTEVLGTYDLEDPYQEALYGFQREYFKEESDLSLNQCLSFCRNVLSYLKLGWITINFLEDGHAAYFSVVHDKLKKKKEEINYEDDYDDQENDESTHPVKEHMIDVLALPDEPIEMAKLSLNIPIKWALNKAVLLHEISHYCAFMLPITIEFFRDKDNYDDLEFEQVFSSHGKVFNSIFAHLLSRFCYIEFDEVYQAMEQHGAPLYPLKNFSEAALYKFISSDLN